MSLVVCNIYGASTYDGLTSLRISGFEKDIRYHSQRWYWPGRLSRENRTIRLHRLRQKLATVTDKYFCWILGVVNYIDHDFEILVVKKN